MKVIPRRVCPIPGCYRMFTPNTKNQKYCDFCRKNRRYEIEQYRNGTINPNPKANADIHKMNAEIEAYNKKHGTCLTYGKYCQMKNAGWLEE